MKQEIIRKLSAAVAMSLVVGVSLAACGGSGGNAPSSSGGSATGSGGTAAGLLLGAGLFLPGVKVTGIAVDSGPFDKIVPRLAGEAAPQHEGKGR